MCGIVGATGSKDILNILIDGLSRLEYRGYDSSGIALQDSSSNKLWRERKVGKLIELKASISGAPASSCGIGHTRWATHGAPTLVNAHPHFDCTSRLGVVHNGIIENFLPLGDELVAQGHELVSETDTEIVAHLVESFLDQGLGLVDAVRQTVKKIEGSFALAVIDVDEPDLIVAVRRVSPLIVGTSKGLSLLASDVPALLGHVEDFFAIEDDQLVELRPGGIVVSDLDGNQLTPQALKIDWDLKAAEKGGFDDFMLKEIHEQPDAVRETLLGRLLPDHLIALDEMRLSDEELRGIDKVFIVGCGTSYHAGLVAKYAIEHWTRLPVEIDIASEFRYRDPVLDSDTLVVGVSQSGETIDTLQAMREAKRWKAKVLVISNVVGSSMAREADAVLYTRAGPEIGVAATKTHLAQIVAMEILALYLAQVRGTLYSQETREILTGLQKLPTHIATTLEPERIEQVRQAALETIDAKDFFFLGRHVGYPVALEGALKLKEISYLRAEGYPAGELKHGPIALIQPGTIVIGVATRTPLWEKMMSNIAEVKARGATVILIANDGDTQTAAQADIVLWVPLVRPLFAPAIDVIPLQLFAYFLAKLKGNDVDQPRNLAKTVTVE